MFKVWVSGYTARSKVVNIIMPKLILLTIALAVIVLTGIVTVYYFNSFAPKGISKSEIDTAINQANFLYRQRKAMGVDFSTGPCISNSLMPGWVVDIVHNPRTSVDELPENQCSAYIEDRIAHFVELDTEGNFIRAK